jgi:hypothetical protein
MTRKTPSALPQQHLRIRRTTTEDERHKAPQAPRLGSKRSTAAGSRNGARKSTSEFTAGQPVRVNGDVRPEYYAGQQGSIVEVRRVPLLGVVRELARRGKRPNNGDVEIGVQFGRISGATTTRRLGLCRTSWLA